MSLEQNLKTIKNSELDIELLKRENEKLCAKNNLEINELEGKIGMIECDMEEELKASKEDKLECKFDGYKGSMGWQKMPDEWEHDDKTLMVWINLLPKNLSKLFIKMVISLKWNDLKKRIISDNDIFFEDSKITDGGLEGQNTLRIRGESQDESYSVEGIEIKRQVKKFKYSIKKIKN